jgi:hypothetical protein
MHPTVFENVHPVDIELRRHPIRHLGRFVVLLFDVNHYKHDIAIVGTWLVRKNPIRGIPPVPPA